MNDIPVFINPEVDGVATNDIWKMGLEGDYLKAGKIIRDRKGTSYMVCA